MSHVCAAPAVLVCSTRNHSFSPQLQCISSHTFRVITTRYMIPHDTTPLSAVTKPVRRHVCAGPVGLDCNIGGNILTLGAFGFPNIPAFEPMLNIPELVCTVLLRAFRWKFSSQTYSKYPHVGRDIYAQTPFYVFFNPFSLAVSHKSFCFNFSITSDSGYITKDFCKEK